MPVENTAAELLAIAKALRNKVPNVDQLACRAIEENMSVEAFRAEMMSRLPSIRPLEKPLLSDVPARDMSRFSISNAIRSLTNRGHVEGLEAEINQEMERQTGQKANGFWVPGQVLSNRSFVSGGITVSSNTLGGVISGAQSLGSEFIEVLRNQAKVLQMGARVIDLPSAALIPKQTTQGTANFLNGETAAATLSAFSLENITLQPRCISSMQQYSKQLLHTSSPSIDMLIRDDINQIIALAIDKAALHGSGASGEPLGIAGTTGINTVSVAYLAASALSTSLFPFMVSLESEIAADNAESATMGFLMRPQERSACKTTPRFADVDTPVWVGGASGTVNGYRAEATNQIAANLTAGTATTICTAIFFGDWSQLLVAQFAGGATDLLVDPYTYGANGVIRLIARRWIDVGVRKAEAFCLGAGLIA